MMGARNTDDRRPCPFCAEMILRDAKVCRFCGRALRAKRDISPVVPIAAVLTLAIAIWLNWATGGGLATGSRSHSVVYSIQGWPSNQARRISSVTYTNAQGGHESEQEPIIPWTREMSVAPGAFLYLSTQDSQYGNEVTVKIIVNGVEARRSDSKGPHAIATASMTCCR